MADEMVLDTNVLSELMRSQPGARVIARFDGRADTVFFITPITRAEILLGIDLLPDSAIANVYAPMNPDTTGCTT